MARTFKKRITHRIEWLLVKGGFAFFGALPLNAASDLAGWVARSIGPRLKVSNIARRNLKAAFPEWDQIQIEAVVEGIWDNVGRYAGEFPHISKLSPQDYSRICEFVGIENHEAAIGKGPIYFAAHLGNWELGGKTAWAVGSPVSAVYRPLNNPYVDTVINTYRNRYQVRGLPKNNAGGRELIKTLKAGGGVAILIDQKMNTGIPVPFFGRDCMTTTSIADLSLKYGCPIIPTRVERIGRAPKFRITIYPPLDFEKTGDHATDVETIMNLAHSMLEDWISERPEQWFWLHKRWG